MIPRRRTGIRISREDFDEDYIRGSENRYTIQDSEEARRIFESPQHADGKAGGNPREVDRQGRTTRRDAQEDLGLRKRVAGHGRYSGGDVRRCKGDGRGR